MVAVVYNFSIMVVGIRMIMSFHMALERAFNSRKKQGRVERKVGKKGEVKGARKGGRRG